MSAVQELIKLAQDKKMKRLKARRKRAQMEAQQQAQKAADRAEKFGHLQDAAAEGQGQGQVSPDNPLPPYWAAAEAKHPGVLFGRILRATAAAKKLKKDGTQLGCVRAVNDIHGDKLLSKWLETELEKALSAGVPSEGGYLVAETLAAGIVDIVTNRMIAMRLGATSLDMPTGNVRVARATSGATSYYGQENVGENASEPSFGDLKLAAKKLYTFVPISNDLLKSASLSVDLFVRRDAARSSTLRKEQAFWTGNGSEDSPRGIKYYTGNSNSYENLTDVAIGGALTADNLLNFMVNLINNKIEVDDMGSFGWAMAAQLWRDLMNAKATTNEYLLREEMMAGTLMGFPFHYTQFLRPNTTSGTQTFDMYFGDWSQVIMGTHGLPEVDASTEAAYLNSSGTLTSAYSNDQTVVRVIDRHDFGIRLPNAIAISDDVTSNNG